MPVNITEGSGKVVDTATIGSNERQIVVVGDPSSSSGQAAVDSTYGLDVDVTRSALPSGASTSANQDTLNTRVGDVTETAPATDTASSGLNGRLQRIAQRLTSLIALLPTSLGQKTMANSLAVTVASDQSAVPASQSGTWNVTNVSGTVSLPTGASTEATLATRLSESDFDTKVGSLTETAPASDTASSGLNGRLQRIAQRLTSLIALVPGSLGQKTMANSFAVTVASDQTVIPVSDNSGSLTVDNAGTFAVQDSQVIADNAGFTDGTSKVFAAGFIYDEVAGTALTENDAAAARINANRAVVGTIEDGATRGRYATVTASNAVKVDGSAVTQPVSLAAGATAIAKAEDVASADADVGVPALAVRKATPANTSGTDGDYEFLQMSAGRLWTSATIDAALPAGTNGIGKLTSNSGVTIGAVEIASAQTLGTVTTVSTVTGGGVAHDGADSGNPLKIGAKALTSLKTTTLVASGDRTDATSDLDGAIVVRNSAPLGDLISERVSDTGGSSTAFSNFSAVASTKNYIRGYSVFNSSATAGYLDFRDGTAGSVLWTVPLPAGGGANIVCDEPLFKTSANTALAYDVSAALTTVYISVVGFQSKA